MGKSPTLTGRTVLWAMGFDVWQDNPLTGVGYFAFWNSPQFARYHALIEMLVDDGLKGFHNAYIETLVAFGVVGALWVLGLIVVVITRFGRGVLRDGSVDQVIWFTLTLGIAVIIATDDTFLNPRTMLFTLFHLAWIKSVSATAPR